MKRVICLIIALILIFSFTVSAQNDTVKVMVNGKELVSDVPPILVNGRTMLPLRAILNGLSVPDENIKWWELSEAVEVNHKDIHIFMAVGSNPVIVNGVKYYLDSTAFVTEGRTMVPVRFLSEALRFNVVWDEMNFTVIITGNEV